MKYFFCGIFIFTFFSASQNSTQTTESQWNPNAGIIYSYTQNSTVRTSSNFAQSNLIIDKNESSAWQSDAPLPYRFVQRKDLNIFLGKKIRFGMENHCENCQKMTDGDLNSISSIKNDNQKAQIAFHFPEGQKLFSISLKCQIQSDLEIKGMTKSGNFISLGQYQIEDNFQFKRFENLDATIVELTLESNNSFDVFEIGGLADFPKEYAIIDFGKIQKVGTIYSKHWAGDKMAKTTNLYISQDGKNWNLIAELNPNSLFNTISNVEPEQNVRFLKIEHTLFPVDWNKASLWEVKVYDKNGHYGTRPLAEPSIVSISEILGVNGYWGWGRKTYSDMLDEGEGPSLYSPISSHARNYHDLTWDLNSPDEKMDFEAMGKGYGTPAKDWLNWDKEYKCWSETGMNIQASVQFFRFKDTDWKRPFASAFEYGKAFAQHFGITHGNGYICSMEVGNEPWKYNAEIYQKILLGMAKGAKAGDSKMEVFPCALQAADPKMEESGIFKNYIGARISQEHLPYLDGINIHSYSYRTNFFGKREGTFPEHKNSSFWEILNAIRWRDHNMPGKKIYLSEWGWDSGGAGEDCTHDVCVSEQAAAAYAVRGTLIAQRLGLDRATWYFFANSEPQSSLYTRSGLTSTAETDFKKKKAFLTLENLIKTIGNQYFIKIIQEDENAWIYLIGDQKGRPTHLVGWRPISGDNKDVLSQKIRTSYRPKSIISLNNKILKLPVYQKGEMILQLTSMPVIIEII